jgi:putative heme-binding domain-containing protein
MALNHLSHPDRAIRFAARISLEHQGVDQWRAKVLELDDPQARILGVIALARNGDQRDQPAAIAALTSLDWNDLSAGQRIDLLRAYGLIAIRLGNIEGDQAESVLAQIGGHFPTGQHRVDRELAQMLVYLRAEGAVAEIVAQLMESPSQENQIHYAMTLRGATQGWDAKLHRQYFQWFRDIQSARGGMSFGGFIENIKKAALQRVPDRVQQRLADVINPPPQAADETPEKVRPLVQEWKVEDLLATVADDDHVPNFDLGKEVFAAAQCYKCHRMGVQGGILGPDLTAAGGRFSPKDLLVSIIDPNKEISDQYGATQFVTDDGRVVVGRVVNMSGNDLKVMTNMLDPSRLQVVKRDTVEATIPAKTSMMPSGLLDTFNKQEIAALVAYLRAGGRASHPIYNKSVASK